jgi:hypothetical protein
VLRWVLGAFFTSKHSANDGLEMGRGVCTVKGAESRPGYDVTNFLCTSLERGAGEASSAGYGREAVKMPVCTYAMAAKRPYAI